MKKNMIELMVVTLLAGIAVSVHAEPVVQKNNASTQNPAKPKARLTKAAPIAASAMVPSALAEPQQQDIVADQVHTGRMVCELNNFVTVTPDPQSSTRFIVQMQKHTFHMTPVVSSTGAIRLEDAQAGAMWLQLSNKSMLMNSKLGQRMADECQSPAQMAVAEAMKLAPPPNLLDGPAIAKK
jgi:hypothetical protein